MGTGEVRQEGKLFDGGGTIGFLPRDPMMGRFSDIEYRLTMTEEELKKVRKMLKKLSKNKK